MKIVDLKKLFIDFGKIIEPSFSPDNSIKGTGVRGFVAIKRQIVPGQWQFLAATKHPAMSQFYIEVGLSPLEVFPLDVDVSTPDIIQQDGKIRFRASLLWANRADGWIINDQDPMDFAVSLFLEHAQKYGIESEGVFSSLEEAVDDMKTKVIKFVLPYFDRVAKR